MSWVWRWNSDWNSSFSGFIFRLMWIEFALALCLQCSCVNYTQFVFSCCPTLLIVIRNSFQMYILFLKNQAEANPKLHPYGANLSRYLTLLFVSLVEVFMAFIITVLLVYSPVFISLLPFPCFLSKCSHARNPSFLAERASNHSSFSMFWLSFCVFSHVGSSCLLLHPGISWQQGMLFHIGKIHVNT